MITATDTGFAIGVRFLTGYSVAAYPPGVAEWPPAPARLFMALVAACQESGADAAELEALRWLEQLDDPPEVIASQADARQTVTVYVPPNDFTSKDRNIVPQWRTNRQPRTFPRVRPRDDTVHFAWSVEPEHAQALVALCEKVTRLGHASSLVQCWFERGRPDVGDREHYRPVATHVDRSTRHVPIRSINPGSLDYLVDLYREQDVEDHFRLDAEIQSTKGKAKKQARAAYEQRFGRPWANNTPPERLRPEMAAAVPYERVGDEPQVAGSCFDRALVMLRLSPRDSRFRRLAAASGPKVCKVFRDALVSHAPDGLAVVTGHTPDGSPSTKPHLAVLPLPAVGGPHADGHLLGIAAALPAGLAISDHAAVMQAIHAVTREGLTLGQLGIWDVKPVPFDDRRRTLQAWWWTGKEKGAQRWATVTPIALDRHPKAKDPIEQHDELAELIRGSCEAIDMPRPARVVPIPVSAFGGVPDAGRFPRLARKDGSKRRQTHAMLWFDEPIIGPVLLGAGRFRGWGVCRPYEEGGRR